MRNRLSAAALSWWLVALLPLGFGLIFFAWPVSALVLRGFYDQTGWTLAGFSEVFASRRTWRIIGFTLQIAALATGLCVLLGIPGAYLLYRCQFRGRGWLRALVSVPFVLPTVVVGVAFGSLFDTGGLLGWLNLDDSFLAILLGLMFFNYSVMVRTTGSLWCRLDPQLGQAASTLGATPARAFLTVSLPALAPAIGAGAALVFLFCASAFGIVMVLGGVKYATLETEIWYQTTQLLDLRAAAALSITQLLIVTACLLVTNSLQKRTQQRLRLHTDRSGEKPFNWSSDRFAATVTGLWIGFGLVLPLANLLLRSLRYGEAWSLQNYLNLAAKTGPADGRLWQGLWNSLWIAAVASLIAVFLGALVALIASRRPASRFGRRALAGVESLFVLPLGVSAVTVGFGYLITLNRPPLELRSSLLLIPIAQAVVALPLVVRSLLPTLRAIDPRQLEAAQSLGSGPWQLLYRIELPQLWRGVGLAAGFALATSLGEFGATAFLARPDNPTLPVLIFKLFGRPGAENYGAALAAATILAGLTAVVMGLAETRRGKEVAAW